MSALTKIREWSGGLEKRGANPYLEWGTTAPPPPGSVGGNVGGLHVTTESATEVDAVYGCVGLLADSVSSLPMRVLDKQATSNTAKELDFPEWLEQPYEMISLTDWLVNFIWSLALRGNFFGRIISRDREGFPTQIMPVNPDIVKPEVRLDGTVQWFFAGKPIPEEDVFHVRYQSMPGHLLGLNPIQIMKYPLGLAHASDVWAAEFYRNSSNPQGVIEIDGPLSEMATKQMIKSWNSSHQGIAMSSMPAILTEGAKFNPISISPADMQLIEQRKYSAEQIAGMVFRIPPHMVGLNERSTSFGRGIEQQERTFVANTLSGYLVRLERALTACLPRGQFVNFDISQRIRGSALERAQTGSLGTLGGFFTPNEVRGKFFDLPPLPDGDKLNSPINTELLEKAIEETKKLQAEPDVKPPPTIVAPPGMPPAMPPSSNGKKMPVGKG